MAMPRLPERGNTGFSKLRVLTLLLAFLIGYEVTRVDKMGDIDWDSRVDWKGTEDLPEEPKLYPPDSKAKEKKASSSKIEVPHYEVFAQGPGISGNVSVVSLTERKCRKNAVVLLGQKKHTTYARDSYGLMIKSLDLLRVNYLDRNQHADNVDVFLFHTGDFDEEDLRVLEPHLGPNGILKLVNLDNSAYWHLPPWHNNDNQNDWAVNWIFPVGYRHMCRWFAIKIWQFFEDLNKQHGCQYQYLMRLDEDSFVYSPIDYDIFDFMKSHDYAYGYRMCAYELDYNNLVYSWFERWHKNVNPKREIDWGLCGFYNNFFVASIDFFRERRVQIFLKELDRRGFIYRKRYGDLLIHTMAVYAFAPQERIHRFLDFTYQHVTIDHILHPEQGCVVWGGIQAGYNDVNASKTLNEYMQKRVWDRNCTANMTYMEPKDLSPTYSHLPEHLKKTLKLQTIVAGKVERPNQGILSG